MRVNIEEEKVGFLSEPKVAGFRLNPNLVPVIACVAYSLASISMTLSNKAMFSYFRFNYPITMLLWQVRSTSSLYSG